MDTQVLPRTPYPTDVSDDEWACVAPYLVLMTAEAPQRRHALREAFNAVRWMVRAGSPWRRRPTTFSLGHLLALVVTPANAQDRAQVAASAAAVRDVTGERVELANVDQGYPGEQAETAAVTHGIRLEVVKLSAAKRGFVLFPRRWVVERSCAWVARFRLLARDYERVPATVVGAPFLALACLLLQRLIPLLAENP